MPRGQAKAAFGGDAENMPSAQIPRIRIRMRRPPAARKVQERSEKLIEGGRKIDDEKVEDANAHPRIRKGKGEFVLHKGKKVHIRVLLA